jgi:hypothetical protein
MKKLILLILLSINIIGFSFEYTFGLEENITNNSNYQKALFGIHHNYSFFDLNIELLALNDNKYPVSSLEDIFYKGYYFYMQNAGINLNFDTLNITFGRLQHRDIVDSPYSLFISSNNNSALILDINYEDEMFLYESRYIELNKDSKLGYPDRGANYKHYGLKLGNFRVIYQESAVYVGESFNLEYFINPTPNFFVQYVNISDNKPWKHGENANSIMGFLFDYNTNNLYTYFQILVDDFNMNRFMYPDSFQNPDKLAWSFGIKAKTKLGNLGLYNAGATKYTFEPYGNSGVNTQYGYTYYPNVSFNNIEIPIQDNYIGYINGENNLSFMIQYNNIIRDINIESYLEYSLSGSKSPANPWHELLNWNENGNTGTKFLDDVVLENRYSIGLNLSYNIFGLKLISGLNLNYILNKLELVEPNNITDVNNIKYYVPKEGNNTFNYTISIGFEYTGVIK